MHTCFRNDLIRSSSARVILISWNGAEPEAALTLRPPRAGGELAETRPFLTIQMKDKENPNAKIPPTPSTVLAAISLGSVNSIRPGVRCQETLTRRSHNKVYKSIDADRFDCQSPSSKFHFLLPALFSPVTVGLLCLLSSFSSLRLSPFSYVAS
jgi:hypothetical protein